MLDLTNTNPTILDGYPHGRIGDAYRAISDFTYRPLAAGTRSARLAIADYYRGHGIAVAPERILVTASTSEAYALLFKLLCDPGSEILIPTPSYPLFDYLAALECVRAVPYRLAYDGNWFIDFDHMRAAVTSHTRGIVLVTPNNPTGSAIDSHQTSRLIALSQDERIPLIVDEVFLDYPLGNGNPLTTFTALDQTLTFSLSGLSKAAGMPQVKLAWIVVNGPTHDAENALERLELISDTFLSVNTPVQNALPDLLRIGHSIRDRIQAQITENYRAARHLLQASAAHPLHADGGWSLILQLPRIMSEEEWVEHLLDDANCVVQPGYFFDLRDHCCIVVSLLTEHENFLHGITLIRDFVAQHA